ncbi:hypothetical protein LTR78_003685 [Recurvomyces mirabilis]|uniref:Uncharacterized protein n=1 Tax=Recurvomyces mirabilis TaxID=574656 RepID=A0AAE1C361_9PEZI|nr:hypothetical protein LTR78_003685 [Recurvomyces mirabilis]KAK5154797.1 hypothetical protein LTS14_006378 [Recurvomyces mirabilis]
MFPIFPSPFLAGGWFGSPMLFPQAGVLPNFASMYCAEDEEADGEWTVSGMGPSRREIRRLQREGLVGPMLQAPGLGPHGAVALPPWMAPYGWAPPGGLIGSPHGEWSRQYQRSIGQKSKALKGLSW